MSNKKARGKRAKTRDKFKKRGPKATVNRLLQDIAVGTSVDIRIDSSVHSGMPARRYHGETGKVISRQGRAFMVELPKRDVLLLVGAAHLTVSRRTNHKKTRVDRMKKPGAPAKKEALKVSA